MKQSFIIIIRLFTVIEDMLRGEFINIVHKKRNPSFGIPILPSSNNHINKMVLALD